MNLLRFNIGTGNYPCVIGKYCQFVTWGKRCYSMNIATRNSD